MNNSGLNFSSQLLHQAHPSVEPVEQAYNDKERGEGDEDNYLPDAYVMHDDFPEITVKGIILALILAIVLAAANVYLGLLVGMTVSASIPSSVLSMAILRLFKNSNILENNMVQTGASACLSVATGSIFTIPGLLILTHQKNAGNPIFANAQGWDNLMDHYAILTACVVCSAVLGVLFSIPLRRAMFFEVKPALAFPEGLATSMVLKSGEAGGQSGLLAVGLGAACGIITKLLSALKLYKSTVGGGWFYNGQYPSFLGYDATAALVAIGYIVGPVVGANLCIGGFVQWLLIIPLSAKLSNRYANRTAWEIEHPDIPYTAVNLANNEFQHARYIGVGMIALGGFYTVFALRGPLIKSVSFGIKQIKDNISKAGAGTPVTVNRRDRDMPFSIVAIVFWLVVVALYVIFSVVGGHWGHSVVITIVVVVLSFLFSAVSAYMAGLVGSSNNPVSGVTIAASLVFSALAIGMFGSSNPVVPVVCIVMCCSLACCSNICGDVSQDLKCGLIVGATPYKQQLVMIMGAVVSCFIVIPTIQLLDQAYVLGEGLQAPQATIIATVPVGLMNGSLPWTYIGIGAGIGVVVIIVDALLARRNSVVRMPILAVAVALYLPLETTFPIAVGALVFSLFSPPTVDGEPNESSEGLLYASGLIAGDSLTGVITAIPIVASGSLDIMDLLDNPPQWPIVLQILLLTGTLAYISKFQPFEKFLRKSHTVSLEEDQK